MNVALTPQLEAPIQQQVKAGLYRDASAVVAYGPHVARFARRHGARHVVVAPQAVDAAFWRARPDGPPWRRGAGFAAVFVGRDEPGKGLDVLLEAWAQVRIEPPAAVLALRRERGRISIAGRRATARAR